jgi:hypothetical protein
MGRRATGRSTVVIRVPKRFEKKVLDYVDYLKTSEKSLVADRTRAEAAGLIELHEIAYAYRINRIDREGRLLPKEKLRAIVMDFFRSYTDK